MLLSCASPPPLRTFDHCRQPPHITPSGFTDKGKAQASAFQPGHCSLVERQLIPLRNRLWRFALQRYPGVPWGLRNASAHKPLSALTLKRHNACAYGICIARRLIFRQVLPRAKSGFAQFDLRDNDFTALSGGSGGGSYIFR